MTPAEARVLDTAYRLAAEYRACTTTTSTLRFFTPSEEYIRLLDLLEGHALVVDEVRA